MNFAEALAEVIRITARPDKVVDATRYLNQAISYCVLKGNFPKDRVEGSLAINGTLFGDTVSISALVRFRRFTYIKPAGVRFYLTRMEADKIFTPKNQMQVNTYYLSGTNLTYILSTLTTSLEYEYLSYPLVLDDIVNTTHWLLDMIPEAIINLAAAKVFSRIGDEQAARTHEGIGREIYVALRNDLSMP